MLVLAATVVAAQAALWTTVAAGMAVLLRVAAAALRRPLYPR